MPCWLAVAALCIGMGQTARAQPLAPAEIEAPAAPLLEPPAEIEEVGPETFYLRDDEGNLVPLPGKWTFEEFHKLLDRQEQADRPEEGPAYSLRKLSALATGEHDRVRIELRLEIVQSRGGWVRVPLRMPKAILRDVPRHEGPGEVLVEYADEQTGFIAWINGEPRDVHIVTCELLIPVETIGEERRWQWHLPSAATSEMTLTVPLKDAQVETAPGGKATGSKTVGDATETRFQGLTGLTRFSWRPADHAVRLSARTLEASGSCLVRLERGYVRSEMTLTLRSFGAPFDRFTVRLPPGAQLVSETIAGGVIANAASDANGAESQGRLYEVKLSQPQTGPLDVRLVTERAQSIAGDPEEIELAGFDVLEAVRQFGHVAVQLEGDWQVLWGESTNARRVETWPGSLPSMDVLAGFEYFGQPFSLPAKVISPPTRIAVEPEYAVYVAAEEMRLDSRIQYRVAGAKVYDLVFDMADWEADSIRVDPASLVNLDALVVDEGGLLRIPLKQPMRGDFEIRLSATRSLAADVDRVAVSLPRPEATSHSAALLAVIPADNVALGADADAAIELASTQLAPRFALPTSQQQTLLYRADNPTARFEADFEVLERQLAVDSATQVVLGDSGIGLSQRWDYNVLHVPLQSITLKVPPSLRGAASLKLLVDEQPVDAGKVLTGNGGFRETISVPLDKPRLGKFSIRFDAELPLEASLSETATEINLPLATVLTGNVASTDLELTVQPELTADVAEGNWTQAPSETSAGAARHFSTAKAAESLTLIVRRLPERSRRGLSVDRAWVRTWFSDRARHDRAVYRFRTSLESFNVGLPGGIEPHQVQVVLDGATVPSVADNNGALRIDLTNTDESVHTLELLYQWNGQGARFAEEIELPRLPEGSWIDQQYWQVVLPRNTHLLTASQDCTPIYRWGWRLLGFGRQPLLRQDDLADWVGVAPGAPIPDNSNQYLFARFAGGAAPRLNTVDRSWIVAVAGGGVLLVGMLLAWMPMLRHPLVILATLLGLLAVGFLYPEPVLVAVQVGAVGLALLLLAMFLRRYAAPDVGATFAADSSSSSGKQTTAEYYHDPSLPRSYDSSVRTSFVLPRSATESNA
ncbi:MAG: hypothetical protein WD030_07200 [Pirellulales bacterium]